MLGQNQGNMRPRFGASNSILSSWERVTRRETLHVEYRFEYKFEGGQNTSKNALCRGMPFLVEYDQSTMIFGAYTEGLDTSSWDRDKRGCTYNVTKGTFVNFLLVQSLLTIEDYTLQYGVNEKHCSQILKHELKAIRRGSVRDTIIDWTIYAFENWRSEILSLTGQMVV
ncbi:hypothetical protein OROMI_020511 [Orobanche minor]